MCFCWVFLFCFVLFLLQVKSSFSPKEQSFVLHQPRILFWHGHKTTKLTCYSKCLPLCKINYIQYNASRTALYLSDKRKKEWERAKAKVKEGRRNHENELRRRGTYSKEISKTIIINTHVLRKMTSSSFEINVQNQSSNPQPILRTKHSYQYLSQLIESTPS